MPPSSLIFVVILAVWGAYLVQHWVRRRDHIATARSVDRFSEAMRVLERRQHLPQTDLSRPVPRSYAVSPIRPASPEVVVKHATPTPAAPSRVTAARVAAGAIAAQLLAQYETDIAYILDHANGAAASTALASWPDKVRGYGGVRERHAQAVANEREQLRDAVRVDHAEAA